jgi:hypothetical protein
LFVFAGVLKALLKSKILSPVTSRTSGKVVGLLFHYGFIVALLVILSGVGLTAWNSYLNRKNIQATPVSKPSAQTSGVCSPAVTGNGNTVTTDCTDNTVPKKPGSK